MNDTNLDNTEHYAPFNIYSKSHLFKGRGKEDDRIIIPKQFGKAMTIKVHLSKLSRGKYNPYVPWSKEPRLTNKL